MITIEMIEAHKAKYPSFDADRLVEWLNEKPGRWRCFPSVAKASKSLRSKRSMDRYASLEHT